MEQELERLRNENHRLKEELTSLIKTGPVALLIALSGVAVPLVGGMLVYMGFGFGTPDTRLYATPTTSSISRIWTTSMRRRAPIW